MQLLRLLSSHLIVVMSVKRKSNISLAICSMLCGSFTLLISLLATAAWTEEPVDKPSVESLLVTIAKQESRRKVLEAYQSLFSGLDDAALRPYLEHQDNGIALQAAWHRLKKQPLVFGKSESIGRKEPLSVQRFLGVVEGRLRMVLPQPWEDGMLTALFNSKSGSVRFPLVLDMKFARSDVGYLVADGSQISRADSLLILKTGEQTIKVPLEAFKYLKHTVGRHMAFSFTAEDCYLAEYDDASSSYKLKCVSRLNSEIRWTATVWSYQTEAFNGKGAQWVTIVPVEDQVFVFGSDANQQYIEAFATDTGKNTLRTWFE